MCKYRERLHPSLMRGAWRRRKSNEIVLLVRFKGLVLKVNASG